MRSGTSTGSGRLLSIVNKWPLNMGGTDMLFTVEMEVGDSILDTVKEAIRLATLLDVLVQYKCNDTLVCVSSRRVVYAYINGTITDDSFFLSHVPLKWR